MIQALNHVIGPVMQSLPFIERWGGVAQFVKLPYSYRDTDGNPVNGQAMIPVTCTPTATNCEPGAGDKLPKLLPDSAWAGLAFLDEDSDLGESGNSPAGVLTFRQDVRLSVWLNLQKLGTAALECGAVWPFQVATYRALMSVQAQQFTPEWMDKPLTVRIRGLRLLRQRPEQVFPGYSFTAEPRLFLWPYAYFGIVISYEASVGYNCACLPDIEPVECISWS